MASFTLETSNAGQARQFEFQSPNVTIGRDRGADFTLDHPTVSRQHAVVSWDGRGYRLVILSRGGLTAIDGQQVGGEVPLHDGALLMFGQLQFVFRSPDAPAHPGHQKPYGQPQPGAQQPVYSPHAFPTASTTGMHASQSNPGLYTDSAQMPSMRETAEFSQWTASGSFPTFSQPQQGAPPQASPVPAAAPAPEPPAVNPPADGLVSWDEIAASADDVVEEKNSLLDFQRMQKEQEAADAETKGMSPLMPIILILAIGGVALLYIYGPKQTDTGPTVRPVVESDDPIIVWRKEDIDCIGAPDCREQALTAFEIGKQTLERQEADIINLYEGYKQLDKAKSLLDKARLDTPPEMVDAEQLQLRAAGDMKMLFLRTRAHYFAKEDQKDYQQMAQALRKLQAYFPDERLNYHAWAQEQVRQMKDDNVYPSDPY